MHPTPWDGERRSLAFACSARGCPSPYTLPDDRHADRNRTGMGTYRERKTSVCLRGERFGTFDERPNRLAISARFRRDCSDFRNGNLRATWESVPIARRLEFGLTSRLSPLSPLPSWVHHET